MRVVVTGTDTDVGKTVFAAALAGAARAHYWKPIQAGLEPETDRQRVQELSGLPSAMLIEEVYRLRTPASIHFAAEQDGVTVEPARLALPGNSKLVVEGAGGVLVPVTRHLLLADVFKLWGLPIVIVSRTALGTINHSLLTIEALRRRGLRILGVAFVGTGNEDSERTICEIGQVKRLGRLPYLESLEAGTLQAAFAANFSLADFR